MHHKPVFVINFKTYDEAIGERGIALAKTIEEVAHIKSVPVIICVPITELRAIASAVKIPVYAQHCDAFGSGAHTGFVTPQMLLAAGAKGTLLNHSEHRLNDHVEASIEAARKAGLNVILCARDATEVKILRNYDVEFIAVEPPELIGGETSVSDAQPDLIAHSSKHCPDRLLVGAGVKNRNDVATSAAHGAKGVLIASHVVRAAKPKDVLLEMMTGW